ncbi:hypothetical protein Asi03nite_61960 [Actinoplanes siamensis]|uniref:Uncharacterized protein n=2 Tax=Actinoplanes siamensis TaxID=1223317 RepID=A0A919ND02_9ACTN|nr:hypothetical protein Asi03nite_61960 [Actinoplanes siamensis]
MASEYAAGREIPEIAARYDVREEYVQRVIEDATAPQPVTSRWSLSNQGNRILIAVLLGWIAWLISGRLTIWTLVVVAIAAYVVTTLVVSVRRRP